MFAQMYPRTRICMLRCIYIYICIYTHKPITLHLQSYSTPKPLPYNPALESIHTYKHTRNHTLHANNAMKLCNAIMFVMSSYFRITSLLWKGEVYCPPENVQHWEVDRKTKC